MTVHLGAHALSRHAQLQGRLRVTLELADIVQTVEMFHICDEQLGYTYCDAYRAATY